MALPVTDDFKAMSMHGSREFLLKDWEVAHRSRETYASMRLGVLGACLTILGLVVSLGKDAEYPGIVGIWIILLLSVFAGVRMLAAVDKVVYIFFSHMATLEAELGEVGFAACWTRYVKKDVRDTASIAFRTAMRLINAAVSLLVLATAAVEAAIDRGGAHRWLIGAFVVAAMFFFVWNEIYIRREFDPRSFLARIGTDLESIREDLIHSRQFVSRSRALGGEGGEGETPNIPVGRADG